MTERTRSQIGRSNRNKGATAERAVVTYLRTAGWPGAERAVRTAYRTAGRSLSDPGDITGTPCLTWQVKDCQREYIADWMEETNEQRREAGAQIGVLVVKRKGHADPARWWAWVSVDALGELLVEDIVHLQSVLGRERMPVRLELQHLVSLLHWAGYGTPPQREAS